MAAFSEARERSLVALVGLMLGDVALAAACEQPSAPALPTDTPIGARAEKKLNRDVARYIADSAQYVVCLIGGPVNRATLDRRIAAAQTRLERDVIPLLNVAIAESNAGRYGEARAAIGELEFNTLTPFERSKAEQILYTVALKQEKFAEAREHVQKAIAAGGLSPESAFQARLAIVNLDVILRLSASDFEGVAEQRAEQPHAGYPINP